MNKLIYAVLLIVYANSNNDQRCLHFSTYGKDRGLQKLEGFDFKLITYDQAKKRIDIAPSDVKRLFFNHSGSMGITISSHDFRFGNEELTKIFWQNIDKPKLKNRKAQLDKVIPNRLGCWTKVAILEGLPMFKMLIKNSKLEDYYYLSAYSYSAAQVFTKPKIINPIYTTIKLRKLGEIFIGLLYNIDIINDSEKGLYDLPAVREIEIDDIGIHNYDKDLGNRNFKAKRIIFKFENILAVYEHKSYHGILDPFKIFDYIKIPDPNKIKVLNYFQLYIFWVKQMKNFFYDLKFDLAKCFEKRFTNDPFALVRCPAVFTFMLDKLTEEEFIFMKDLSQYNLDFNPEIFKTALFKIFTMMKNMKSILEKKFDFNKMQYENPKKEVDNDDDNEDEQDDSNNSFESSEENAEQKDEEIQAKSLTSNIKEISLNESPEKIIL